MKHDMLIVISSYWLNRKKKKKMRHPLNHPKSRGVLANTFALLDDYLGRLGGVSLQVRPYGQNIVETLPINPKHQR